MFLEHVSVIIPTYNRARLLERALLSVLAALIPGDEVIVVDDGSTDDTAHVVAQVIAQNEGRVRYLCTANGGAGRARNRGIQEARSPLVSFLDSDDEWAPDRLSLGRALLAARPDVLFCFSDFGLRHEGVPDRLGGLAGWHRDSRPWNEILGVEGVPYSQLVSPPEGRTDFQVYIGDLYPRLLETSFVPVQTLLVRRDRAGPALRFPEDIPTYEDWEFVARIARVGPGAYLDCATAWQWGHSGPRLTDAGALTQATTRITMIDRLWASDPEYLLHNRQRVGRVLQDLNLIRAKELLKRGRGAEAREALRHAGRVPLAHRSLAMLPGLVARELVAFGSLARRAIRRLA